MLSILSIFQEVAPQLDTQGGTPSLTIILVNAALATIPLILAYITKRQGLADAKAEALQNVGIGVVAVAQRWLDAERAAGATWNAAKKAQARADAIQYALTISGPMAAKVIKAWTDEEARIHVEAAVKANK